MIKTSKCRKCNGNNLRVEITYSRGDVETGGWSYIDIKYGHMGNGGKVINLLKDNKRGMALRVMTNCNDCRFTSSRKPKISIQLDRCPDCGNTKAECVDYEYVNDGVFDIDFKCSRCSHEFSSKGKFDNSKSLLQKLFSLKG